MTTNNKPVFERRLNNIRVSVWANANDKGTWFNTVVTRRYKDGEEEWRDSNSFSGLADLALVAEAVRLARDYIAAVEAEGTSNSAVEGNE